jgi:hypothetical protein
MRSWSGASQHHMLLVPDPSIIHRTPVPLRALIRVRHVPGGPGELERLAPATALIDLWASTLRHDSHALELATATIRRQPVYELRSSTVAEAVRILGGLLPV